MKRYLAYLKSVLRHKKFVYEECLKLGVPRIIAILHDWDKFLPDEFIPYANCFYKHDGRSQYQESTAFSKAWMKHQQRNKHHWQYWVNITGYDENYKRNILIMDRGNILHLSMASDGCYSWDEFHPIEHDVNADPMSDLYRREMLADWRGAGRAYGNPDTKGWYLERRDTVFAKFIHPDTLKWLDEQLGV